MFVNHAQRFLNTLPKSNRGNVIKKPKHAKIVNSVPSETQSVVPILSDGGCEKSGL